MKRYVEVDVQWNNENETWYEYDGYGGYDTYAKVLTFSDILKERFGEELYTLLYDIIAEWYKAKGTYADLVKDIISLLTKEDEK
jgi:hypothetical protein